jgi:hypothetical protein
MTVTIQLLSIKEQSPGAVTIQQRHRCAHAFQWPGSLASQAACDVCSFAHEQAADSVQYPLEGYKADGVPCNRLLSNGTVCQLFQGGK